MNKDATWIIQNKETGHTLVRIDGQIFYDGKEIDMDEYQRTVCRDLLNSTKELIWSQ